MAGGEGMKPHICLAIPVIRLICEAVAVELLFYAMLAIFAKWHSEWRLPNAAAAWVNWRWAMLVSLVLLLW